MHSIRVVDQRLSGIGSADVSTALAELQRHDLQSEGVGVYLHLPFCPTRCISCARAAAVASSPKTVDRYLDYLEREIAATVQHLGAAVPARQLLVGGGSPNHLTDAHLARVMDIFERYFTLAPGAEVAIDINPKRSSRSQLELLYGLGFRSLHFELREIDPSRQFALGRSCTPELLEDVFLTARESGMDYLQFDYVYGMPDHTHGSVRDAAEYIAELAPDRVVCHPFFRREDVFPHQQLIGADTVPSASEKMGLFTAMVDTLETAGYTWVGINCFVREDDPLLQAQERGELYLGWLGYATQPQPWLLGFGLGATSELPGLMMRNSLQLQDWYDRIDEGLPAALVGTRLSNQQAEVRDAVMQLGANLRAPFGESSDVFDNLESEGLVSRQGAELALTSHGRYRLNEHWEEALAEQRPFSLIS